MAPRDIFPRSGLQIQLYEFKSPISSDYNTALLSLKSTFYFPGLFKNHHLRFNIDYEYQLQSYFASLIQIRGYETNFACERKMRLGANYALPLAFPDLALGQYFYLRRIALNLFADHGYIDYIGNLVKSNNSSYSYYQPLNSYGGELMLSFNLLNFPYAIHTGIRASYRALDKTMFYEVLPVSISF